MDVMFDQAENEWAPLIGKFIVDFVMIDDAMFDLINKNQHRLTDKELKDIEKFKSRVKLFKKVLKTYLEPTSAEQLDEVMRKISDLYVIRNLLAHNSLTFAYEQLPDQKMTVIGFQVNGRKSELSINITELKEKAGELVAQRARFSDLIMVFYKAEFELISNTTSA
jgi:hypothetical protein